MAQTPIYYRPPTKLRESNAFSHVCLFTRVGGGDSHVTINHDALNPTVQDSPPPGHGTPLYKQTPLPTWDLTTCGFSDMELHCTAPPSPEPTSGGYGPNRAVRILLECFFVSSQKQVSRYLSNRHNHDSQTFPTKI